MINQEIGSIGLTSLERNEYIMELPNNTRSSQAAKQMEFAAEGFNPELTTEERCGRQRNLMIWFG